MRESSIESYLVRRAREEGDEVRKVVWVNRRNAPDRLLLVRHIWIELKRPGRAAKFPADAHERAQHREHERMRKAGHRVEVVDSFERIEEILNEKTKARTGQPRVGSPAARARSKRSASKA